MNGSASAQGTYSGTANLATNFGSFGLPVSLTIGTGGTTGVVASQNPVSLSAISSGAGVNPVFLTFTLNGTTVSPTSIQSATTTTGQSWLQAQVVGSQVEVSATTSVVSNGTYSGTVVVNTTGGQASFQVNLSIGSGGTTGLTASPNPVNFFTSFSGGGISPQTVTVFYNGTAIAASGIQSVTTTTGQSWLSAQIQGSAVLVSANSNIVGIGSYIGTVTATTVYGPVSFQVNLDVGTNGGNSNGLVATPSSVNFSIAYGSGTTAQSVAITYNGFATTIQNVQVSYNGSGGWLLATPTSSGVSLGINGAALLQGTYTASVSVTTLSGTVSIPVTLTVGNGGSTSGLAASPNPVNLSTTQTGGSVSPQTVTITYNGSPVTISGLNTSTSSGQNWLIASIVGSNLVSVGANTSILSVGSYTGTVIVTTNFGQMTFTVSLLVGVNSTSGLTANPNPVTLTAATVGGAVQPQVVNILYNGSSVSVIGVSATTTTGVSWLQASSLGASVQVSANSANLGAGVYTGAVNVVTSAGNLSFQVNLNIASGGTGTGNPLTITPDPILFTESTGGQGGTQTVTATYNGSVIPIVNATFSPSDLFTSFVNVQVNSSGSVTLTLNNIATNPGTYSGTLLVYTTPGQINVPVTLQIGVGGTTSGLVASPNPVNFNVQTGGSASPQVVNITNNGSPVGVTSVSSSTTTGQAWLIPTAGASSVTISVAASGLSSGTYSGTVNVTTTVGLVAVQVNLTVGGTPTLSVTPTSLNFYYQVGTNIPIAQTLQTGSNGSGINLSVSSSVTSGGTNWLIVTPSGQVTSGTPITVSVQPQALTAGTTYTGNIVIQSFGGASNGSVTIPVGLLVTTSPVISASPASLTFTAQQGTSPAAQTISISSSSTQLSYTVSATTTNGSSWLQLPAQSGFTPGSLTVGVNTNGLIAGTYTGTVTVQASGAGNPVLSIPVTLNVTGGSVLQLPASLSFAYEIGQAQPQSQVVTVGSSSGSIGFTANATSGTFLLISPASGTAPGTFTVSVNTTGLTAGSYNGSISVTNTSTGTPQTIPVTLVVSTTALFSPNPASTTFNVPAGSSTPVTQQVQLNTTDGTSFSFSTSVSSNGNWLSATAPTTTTPTILTVTANPAGLAQGTYTGTVALTVINIQNVANSPLNYQVTLVVGTGSGTGGGGVLAASPTSLTFSQASGGPVPAAQTLSITGPAGATFSAVASLNFGQNWLTISPTSFTLPATLTVSANGATLAQGTYNGSIVISTFGAGSSLTVPVSLTVSSTAIVPALIVTPGSLAAVNYQIGGVNPAPQTLAVSVSNGAAVPFTAVASASSGGNWLAVSPVSGNTPANVSVTVSPAGLSAGTYSGTVSITVNGASGSPLNLPITLTVTQSATTPSVVAIQNAASSIPTSISPGLNIVIYGSNMGPANIVGLQLSPGGGVATSLSGTQVTFDGTPAPVIYTKSTQVSVMVPYEIAGRAATSMVVIYNGVSSTPTQLRVVDTAPGLYTINMTGTGPGAILNQNGTVNGPGNPDVAGDIIQIFMTGEGQTTPAGVDGAVSPNRLPLPVPLQPVSVTVGGINASVVYAGEAPGIVSGVMQVNAVIPPGLGSGPVPVVVTVGGVQSQANVTVSVR